MKVVEFKKEHFESVKKIADYYDLYFADRFEQCDQGFVLIDENETVCGCLHYYIFKNYLGYVDLFAIKEDHRGMDNGYLLGMEMVKNLIGNKINVIQVQVRDDQVGRSLLRFFRQLGCHEDQPLAIATINAKRMLTSRGSYGKKQENHRNETARAV